MIDERTIDFESKISGYIIKIIDNTTGLTFYVDYPKVFSDINKAKTRAKDVLYRKDRSIKRYHVIICPVCIKSVASKENPEIEFDY